MNDLEHPDITKAQRNGLPDGEANAPHCPVCGEWCDVIYRDRYGKTVGCDNCMKQYDAWEVSECFPEED